MSYEQVKQWRQSNKRRLVESFGGKCGICGYNRCNAALEFHHIDPDEKEITFSAIQSWEKTVIEARKCVMLCANCHREVHNDMREITEETPRFDESYAIVSYDKDVLDNCPICGKEKHHRLKTCSRVCSGKIRHKIDWSVVDLNDLMEECGSYLAIADKLGVSDATVRKRYLKLNLR